MPPKKREKDVDPTKNPRMDHIQADHELFLQAFEKPTQIYRYLRTRNMCSPIFLNRTLTYMRYRMSRSHKNRQGFKINHMLEKLTEKRELSATLPGFMNITFLGFYDKNTSLSSVQVEAELVKFNHKKRKDSAAPSLEVSLGVAEVIANPTEMHGNSLAPTISIPTDTFNLSGGPLAKSYMLLLYVNKECDEPDITRDEPALKRRKSNLTLENRQYSSQLVVYDKYSRCLLLDADYELVLQEVASKTKNSPKKYSSWENVSELGDCCATLDSFLDVPTLKFKLKWSQEPSERLVERPKLYPVCESQEMTSLVAVTQPVNGNGTTNTDKVQIVYQFVYNNNSRQQTEACEDLHCPWCSLICNELYTLLKHLKLCHSRFTFTYVPISVGARIDVAINELYDGSYTGSPHDLISQPTVCAFSRNGPVRRASVTHILVCHPKRPKPSLSEFLELDDCEYDGQRPFITGHNRLYHHTTTCLPIYPKEMDVDSEGENDPAWLRCKTLQMIDEFTDVNDGEKELMKMWNLHVMKYGFVGDCQIPVACQMFVQHRGKELLLKNLYRNFVVHMSSLFDFGLVSAVCLYTTLKKLQDLVGETVAIRTVLKDSREKQMENWNKYGSQMATMENKPTCSKTPVRKITAGMQRRKGTATPGEALPNRRKSIGGDRKRISLSLKQPETKGVS